MTVTSSATFKISSGNRVYQYVAAIAANLGIICSEMHYAWPSPYVPVLVRGEPSNYTFRISEEEGSWLTVIPLIGAIVGAFITGLIVDTLGRKRLVVFSAIPFIASWLCVAFARSSALMFFGRFLAGAADGLSFTAVPMYLGEIAEPKIRGLLASVCPVCIVFGLLLVHIFGAYLPLDTAALAATALPILLLVIFPWMPESPYFYLMKGNVEEARKSLQSFRGIKDVSAELNRISQAVKEQNENRGTFFQLFTVKSNRRGMIITLGLRGFQQLSGTTAIIFYCRTVFDEAKDFMDPNISTIIYFTVQLFLSAVSSFIVDFSGRRPLLISSMTGTALSLLANGIYLYLKNTVDLRGFDFVPIVALICFVVVFSLGLQTIPLLIMGEIFPTNVKAFALCSMDIYYSVIVTLISLFFNWTNETYGMHVPFFAFAGCCILGLVFVVFYVPETKGKTLEEIQMELQGRRKIAGRRTTGDGRSR